MSLSRNWDMPSPMMGFGSAIPLQAMPRMLEVDQPTQGCGHECSAAQGQTSARDNPGPDTTNVELDEEMVKRREINAIREQMNIAATNEDFEKAAQLRDKIKEMEQ